ncbi:MAG: hypothetical protein LBQ52_05385 [Helicobacteraceae bacterium]|jgi:hypothetical protein|nr:hypothetical protein [Helicobacteraceae bacterium]
MRAVNFGFSKPFGFALVVLIVVFGLTSCGVSVLEVHQIIMEKTEHIRIVIFYALCLLIIFCLLCCIGFSSKERKNEEFEKIMQLANGLAEQKNKEGIRDLIKIIMRKLQYRCINESCLINEPVANFLPLYRVLGLSGYVPSIDCDVERFMTGSASVSQAKKIINLQSNVVLTAPNKKSSLYLFGKIGSGLPFGPYVKQPIHDVLYVYPLDIGVVMRGNNSITQAIIRQEPVEMEIAEYRDYTKAVEAIRYDGVSWRLVDSGKAIGTVPKYQELAYVWELTRRIIALEAAFNK